ncbi:hypothetical protein GCM10025857_35900 [Alicyclobacillus contaminans]|uniref:hypothetical protein n=1 Tax=Alicyclobacillus contaminans TaxID=392016 RepID=UPI0003F58A1B|nr:hypothetical protein [Alicyclobacillus contaminans]GMA52233.1 hypothetical protein GCM10025857_35900 [Alicyclobacillus contaminans]
MQIQMEILKGLVTETSLQDMLSLLITGVERRFGDCIAAIWVLETKPESVSFTLRASVNLPESIMMETSMRPVRSSGADET